MQLQERLLALRSMTLQVPRYSPPLNMFSCILTSDVKVAAATKRPSADSTASWFSSPLVSTAAISLPFVLLLPRQPRQRPFRPPFRAVLWLRMCGRQRQSGACVWLT